MCVFDRICEQVHDYLRNADIVAEEDCGKVRVYIRYEAERLRLRTFVDRVDEVVDHRSKVVLGGDDLHLAVLDL